MPSSATDSGVDLYWLPLGAGGSFVRFNGRVFEALSARREHRAARPLFHSALIATVAGAPVVVEMTPVLGGGHGPHGTVAEGPVGARWAGRSPLFRYEIRRWLGGTIGDVGEAVDSPQRLSASADTARRLLTLVPSVPTLVWGRDELGTGDMWNSNSLVSWLLARSGLSTAGLHPPQGGRAPGWQAGLVAAAALTTAT